MKVEAHWSTLKRLFLMPYNRPRVDLLIHIIDKKMLLKFSEDYECYNLGLKKPHWWKHFVAMWKRTSSTTINDTYITDKKNFTCSCPFWLSSQFFICKHLTNNTPCPKYHEVSINRVPPFLVIDSKSTRRTANFDCARRMNRRNISIQSILNSDSESTPAPLFISTGIEDTTVDESKEKIAQVDDTLKWLSEHIADLKLTESGYKQLEYINDNVFGRLRSYRDNVEKNLNCRQAPKTWSSADTCFLP